MATRVPASVGRRLPVGMDTGHVTFSAIARTRVTTHDCAGATWTDGDPLVKQTVTAEKRRRRCCRMCLTVAEGGQFQTTRPFGT